MFLSRTNTRLHTSVLQRGPREDLLAHQRQRGARGVQVPARQVAVEQLCSQPGTSASNRDRRPPQSRFSGNFIIFTFCIFIYIHPLSSHLTYFSYSNYFLDMWDRVFWYFCLLPSETRTRIVCMPIFIDPKFDSISSDNNLKTDKLWRCTRKTFMKFSITLKNCQYLNYELFKLWILN